MCKKCCRDVKCNFNFFVTCCFELRTYSLILACLLLTIQISALCYNIISPFTKEYDQADYKGISRFSQIGFGIINFTLWIILMIGIVRRNIKVLLLWVMIFGLFISILFIICIYFLPLCILILIMHGTKRNLLKSTELLALLFALCIFGAYTWIVVGSYLRRLTRAAGLDELDEVVVD